MGETSGVGFGEAKVRVGENCCLVFAFVGEESVLKR